MEKADEKLTIKPKVYNATTQKVKRKNKSDLGEDYVAPDGGWGWVVCVAAGLSNMAVFPGLQQFGLIYKHRLEDLSMSSTKITTIINVQYALCSLTGLINGMMFRKFTFREVGILGAVLVFSGLLSTAWSQSFVHYLISFSLLYGLGMGFTTSSASLVLNTYFKEKRRKATGFSWTITGIGPIAFPHLVVLILSHYGYFGAVSTFAAISLHSLLAAICYQPALRHSKNPPKDAKLENGTAKTEAAELLEKSEEVKPPKIEEEKIGFVKKFIKDLDLALLKDFTFVNILVGLTIIIFGELNFSILVPFILSDSGFEDHQISLAMSILGAVDITMRFVAPFVTQKLSLGNKTLFGIGILCISTGRCIVALSSEYYVIIFALALVGFGKALRTIFNPLIVAGYVPLKRLPAAYGLQFVFTAVFALAAGPVLGLIKQYWGYSFAIHIINTLSVSCLASWAIEAFVSNYILNKGDKKSTQSTTSL
ncbi:hypothetical protein ACFFRR_003336 [Megaselia abdita]